MSDQDHESERVFYEALLGYTGTSDRDCGAMFPPFIARAFLETHIIEERNRD
jgi:hypothetical protein